ncbi:MAG: lysostaphin resistance A-like protein [Anaerotignum sp.]
MNQTKQTNIFALIFFMFFIISAQLLYMVPFIHNLPYEWFSSIIQITYFVVPIVGYFIWTKKNPKEIFRLYPLGWKNFILIVLFGFAIQPLMNFFSFLTSMFFPNVALEAFDSLQNASILGSLITMAVLPALLEELSLRGVFLSGYSHLGTWKSIFCTALLFGLLHMNPQQFPYAFIAGLFFCFLVQRTGSIWASIIPHFIINATSVVAMFISTETPVDTMPMSNTITLFATVFFASLSIPFLALIFYIFIVINPAPAEPQTTHTTEKFLSIPIYCIFALFFIFGILPYIGDLFSTI